MLRCYFIEVQINICAIHQFNVFSFTTKSVVIYIMNIQEAKAIPLADYLQCLGYSPVKRQGCNLWYKSPLRTESEPSFKVNTELNRWFDFGQRWQYHRPCRATLSRKPSALIVGTHRTASPQCAPHADPIPTTANRTEFSTVGNKGTCTSCLVTVLAGTGNRCGNRPKRVQGTALHPQRKALLCHRLPERGRRLRGTQSVLQSVHRPQRDNAYTERKRTKLCLLPVRGVHGLPLVPYHLQAEATQPRLDGQGLYHTELSFQYRQSHEQAGRLRTHPLFLRQ